ncbi:MAG: acyl carrier protein [Planctomycetota bacterium]|jgi:acyl carrier protein
MATVFERVKQIVVELLAVREDEVVPEASFLEDLGADSLDFIRLIESYEKEFGDENKTLKISEDEAQNLLTVQQAVDFLQEKGMGD